MAALNFPSSPAVNDTHTENGRSWQWDGTSWNALASVQGGERATMPSVSVKRTTNLTTDNNNNAVTFDSVEHDDTSGAAWTLADPTKLVVPAAWNGLRVVFHGEGIWDTTADSNANYRELKIFKNGDTSNPIAVAQHSPAQHNTGIQVSSRPIPVATGDAFTLCAKTNASETLLAADNYSVRFSMTLQANNAYNGWTPEFKVVTDPGDSTRKVLKIVNWFGGVGTKPPVDTYYLGTSGHVTNIADAENIRGTNGVGGGTDIGQAVPYPTSFDGSDTFDGSSTTPFANVNAFTSKTVVSSRILKLVSTGTSFDHRVRVTPATARTGVFDIRLAFASSFSKYNSDEDGYLEIRLSQSDDTQIALFRFYGRFLTGMGFMSALRMGSKLGAGAPLAVGNEFDPLILCGLPVTLQIKRDGSNLVTANYGLGSLPMALVPVLNGAVAPKSATVSGTLARIEISHKLPATADATTSFTTFVDYVLNA